MHGKSDINAGDVLIAIGGQREGAEAVKWFDLRPLNFVEGYALLRSVRDEYECVKLILRTDVFPQGLGCSRVVIALPDGVYRHFRSAFELVKLW